MEEGIVPMLCGDRIYLRLMEASDISLKVKWTNDPVIRETLIMDYTSETKNKTMASKGQCRRKQKRFYDCFQK